MRRPIAIAGVLAALSFGSAPALAFQETPVPPPVPTEAPQAVSPPVALQLGKPSGVAAPKEEKGGLNLFGYTLLPKLDFGLDVLYGQDQQQLQLQGPTTLDENGDVTVLGKVKRRF
jgi:hypothetical protein